MYIIVFSVQYKKGIDFENLYIVSNYQLVKSWIIYTYIVLSLFKLPGKLYIFSIANKHERRHERLNS